MDLRGADGGDVAAVTACVYTYTHTHTPHTDKRKHINLEYFNSNKRDERAYYFINVRSYALPANTRYYSRPCL